MWMQAKADDLRALGESPTTYLLICSPFITQRGVYLLLSALPDKRTIKTLEVWTRLNERDVLQNATHPTALRRLRDEAAAIGASFIVQRNDNLHAKAIVTDNAALAGSANLTGQGYESGVEIHRFVTGTELDELLTALTDIADKLDRATSDDLDWFFGLSPAAVDVNEVEPEPSLPSPQSEPRTLFPLLPPEQPSYEDFLRFLSTLAVENDSADKILTVSGGMQASWINSEGRAVTLGWFLHIRHSFEAVQQFLEEQPQYIDLSLRNIKHVGGEDVLPIATKGRPPRPRELDEMIEEWFNFMERGSGPTFLYLRKNLGSSYGGERVGGSGAGTALRETWPLVARYLHTLRG